MEKLLERTRVTRAGILEDSSPFIQPFEGGIREKVERFRPMKADEDVETYLSSFEVHMTTYREKREDWTKCRLHYLNRNQTESISAWTKIADEIMMW